MTGNNMRFAYSLIVAGIMLSSAHSPARPPSAAVASGYAPFEYLIGEWHSQPSAGMALRQSFRWGPRRSYILYSTYTAAAGQPDSLHFEGIMVWNGRSKRLDYVFAVEPGSGVQERGEVRAEADGAIVREVELTTADGAISRFRQTFRRSGRDTAVTSLVRETPDGWRPSFPGSELIVMRRTGS